MESGTCSIHGPYVSHTIFCPKCIASFKHKQTEAQNVTEQVIEREFSDEERKQIRKLLQALRNLQE